jgi:hypothetical protein
VAHRNNGTNRDVVEALHSSRPPPNPAVCIASIERPASWAARRGIEPRDNLGRHRDVVERSLAWLVGYRRLQVRDQRRADVLLGFLPLACALLCLKAQGPSEA